jgi:hypothetical protein
MVLAGGERILFAFGTVVPPFLGQDFLEDVDGTVDEKATRSVSPARGADSSPRCL